MSDEPTSRRDFAVLYRATLAPLRRYLARFLGDATEAQDIAHDAYLRVYPAEGKRPAERPEALLYTTARRLAINRIKHRRIAPFVRNGLEPETMASPAPGVVQQVMARQELRRLEQAIRQLPPGCRAVLLLRKVELLSHREIAQRLGIAISTVEKQHARALRLLRTSLATEFDQTAPGVATPAPEEDRL
ncbi:MAG TPA: sigma-70 family RNA polymerase sigma factor [Opitutaceae bacterium]|nr:sigma-70 family RNA polymerase sigma factor [Opitutaceae bacterium]